MTSVVVLSVLRAIRRVVVIRYRSKLPSGLVLSRLVLSTNLLMKYHADGALAAA